MTLLAIISVGCLMFIAGLNIGYLAAIHAKRK